MIPKIKISWLGYVCLSTVYIFALNFNILYKTQALAQNNTLLISLFLLYGLAVFCVCALIANKYLAKPIMAIFIIVGASASYFIKEYGVIIDHNMIGNAANTDPREIKDLVSLYMFGYLFCVMVVPLFILFRLEIGYGKLGINLAKQIITVIISAAMLGCVLFFHSQSIVPFFRSNNNLRMYNVPFYQLYSIIKFIKLKYAKKRILKKIGTDATQNPSIKQQKRLLVLVIGETARAANYAALGYTKNNTNFYTNKLGARFYKGTSCGTYTAKSLPCMLSYKTKATHSQEDFEENVTDVLAHAGVKTSWYDNNSGGCKGQCDRLADAKEYSAPFDDILLKDLEKNLASNPGNEMIVLHLQGSHGPSYFKRYPKSFKRFTPTCDTSKLNKCSLEAVVNTYDNSLLYTDYLLSRFIKLLLAKKDVKSELIYLSDHGESLGENGVFLHGMPYFLAPDEQKQIPVMIWGQKHIRKGVKDISQDDLFSTILGYFGVKSKVYDKSLDILAH